MLVFVFLPLPHLSLLTPIPVQAMSTLTDSFGTVYPFKVTVPVRLQIQLDDLRQIGKVASILRQLLTAVEVPEGPQYTKEEVEVLTVIVEFAERVFEWYPNPETLEEYENLETVAGGWAPRFCTIFRVSARSTRADQSRS